MGMHVWYGLALEEKAPFAEAIDKIAALHRYAKTVGFRGAYGLEPVGEIEMGDGTHERSPTFALGENWATIGSKRYPFPPLNGLDFTHCPGRERKARISASPDTRKHSGQAPGSLKSLP